MLRHGLGGSQAFLTQYSSVNVYAVCGVLKQAVFWLASSESNHFQMDKGASNWLDLTLSSPML